jgi:hypothetical protein
MSYYKVTFAVESNALGSALENLALGIREGVISKSFVVEREEESVSLGAHKEPPRIKADSSKQIRKQKRGRPKREINGKNGQLGALTDHVRLHGPASYADLGKAIAARGFSKSGVGSAITRALAHGLLRKQGDGVYVLAEAAA